MEGSGIKLEGRLDVPHVSVCVEAPEILSWRGRGKGGGEAGRASGLSLLRSQPAPRPQRFFGGEHCSLRWGWRMNWNTLQQGQREGKASGCPSGSGPEKECGSAED